MPPLQWRVERETVMSAIATGGTPWPKRIRRPSLGFIALLGMGAGATAQCVQTEQQEFHAADGANGDVLGAAVALDGDLCLAGAFGHEHAGGPRNAGAAYLFARIGGQWSELEEWTASDAEQGDRFGYAADLDGEFAVVSAPWADSVTDSSLTDRGAVYIYRETAGSWAEFQILAPSGENQDQLFGHDLALHGEVLVVGAPGDDTNGDAAGAVHVFRFDGSLWQFEGELHPSDATTEQEFGFSVASDGMRWIAGAPEDGPQSVGAGYVFLDQGGTWTQEQKLVPSGAGSNDFFGDHVDLDGVRAVVGSVDADNGTGSAVVFHHTGGAWQEEIELQPSDAAPGMEFGSSLALEDDRLLVGALFADSPAASASGAAYLFRFGGTSWVEQVKLVASDAISDDLFGLVELAGPDAMVGAGSGNGGTGSLYAFELSELSLSSNQATYDSGDTATFTTCGTVPGSVALLYAISPFVLRIARGVSDAEGRWSFSATVPPGLNGVQATFLSFGSPRLGELDASNPVDVNFQ